MAQLWCLIGPQRSFVWALEYMSFIKERGFPRIICWKCVTPQAVQNVFSSGPWTIIIGHLSLNLNFGIEIWTMKKRISLQKNKKFWKKTLRNDCWDFETDFPFFFVSTFYEETFMIRKFDGKFASEKNTSHCQVQTQWSEQNVAFFVIQCISIVFVKKSYQISLNWVRLHLKVRLPSPVYECVYKSKVQFGRYYVSWLKPMQLL